MEALAQRFIDERARRGASGRGRRVPDDLRRLAVRFAMRSIADGGSVGSAARRLGVHDLTLKRWIDEIRHDEPEVDAGFRQVVVQTAAQLPQPASSLSLITPTGFRIEGLSLSEIPALLSQLR